MTQLAMAVESGVLEAEMDRAKREPARPDLAVVPVKTPNQTLHGGVYRRLAVIYVALLAAFWVTFQSDAEALFMVAISGVYLAAYVGTPYVMSRVGGRIDPVQEKPFGDFLKEPFETWTGVMTGRQAMVQILTVPVAVLIAGCGMGLIIAASR